MGMSARETVRLLYQLEGWPNAWPEQINDVCATPGLSPGPQVPDVARPFAKSFPAPTRVAVRVVLPPGVP